MPPPNICDYVILDIPTNSTRGYNRLDYDFLKVMSPTSKFLFTLPRDTGISTDMELINMTSFVEQQNFRSIARELYNYMPVRGFGYLHFNYGPSGNFSPLASYVVNVYEVCTTFHKSKLLLRTCGRANNGQHIHALY
ncbi:uncharacterized protein ISCGN_010736 [Ixodes scapularis]